MTEPLQHNSYPPGSPEVLFRVGEVATDHESSAGSMESGEWMMGPDGIPSFGTLGLLVDTVFGASILRNGPGDHWAVTTETSLTRCSSIPVDGQQITARSRIAHLDTVGGVSHGEVRAADGRLIALGTQHVRFTAGAVMHERSTTSVVPSPPGVGVLDMLGARHGSTDGRTTLELQTTGRVANPLGNVHGGVLLALSEIAGLLSVQSVEHPVRSGSLHQVFLRPAPIGELLRIETRTLYRGRTLAATQVSSIRADGKVCTVATVTCYAADGGEGGPTVPAESSPGQLPR